MKKLIRFLYYLACVTILLSVLYIFYLLLSTASLFISYDDATIKTISAIENVKELQTIVKQLISRISYTNDLIIIFIRILFIYLVFIVTISIIILFIIEKIDYILNTSSL